MPDNSNSTPQIYSSITSPWAAIELCLHIAGNWKLSQEEIVREIVAGGYLGRRPKAARGLLKDSIQHHLEIGALSLKGDPLSLKGQQVGMTASVEKA